MGQLGFQELLIIFVIALLVFGPRKLPELGKSLGKSLREFKKATEDLKTTWEDQVREVENPIKDVTKDLKNVGNDLEADFYSSPGSQSTSSAVPKEQA